MHGDNLLKFAQMFCSLAGGEELPEDSDNLKTVLGNLEKLETYSARKEYAKRNFERLSSGSSRIVFLTDGGSVIKLASNDRGIAQNKAESHPKKESKYLNPIISHAKNYSWLQTHYLEKITVKEFQELTDLDFEDFGEAIRYALKNVADNSGMIKPKHFEEVSKSDIFKELKEIGKLQKLMPGDLARISSYGVKDKHPVLIDSGLTSDIFESFYEDSDSSKSSSVASS